MSTLERPTTEIGTVLDTARGLAAEQGVQVEFNTAAPDHIRCELRCWKRSRMFDIPTQRGSLAGHNQQG